jgi:hypothetical protein
MPTTQLPDPAKIGHPTTVSALTVAVVQWLKLCQQQVNRISSGSINGSTTASTSQPPSPSATIYAAGDYIRNTAPQVLGTSGSQYVVKGWLCVQGGQPGTWVQDRGLTGT